jgi:hypothetical protein
MRSYLTQGRVAAMVALTVATVTQGCLCASAEVCTAEAEAAIADEAPALAWSVDATAREIAETWERACDFGRAQACREALAFWVSRPEEATVRDADEDFTVVLRYPRAQARGKVDHLLRRLTALVVADARRVDSRRAWQAILDEFPGTPSARLAERERDRIIIASLSASGRADDHLAELSAPGGAVLAHVEAWSGALEPSSGEDASVLVALAERLNALRPGSPAVANIAHCAEAAAFREARGRDTVAAWDAYLARFGRGGGHGGLEERVRPPQVKRIVAPVAGRYRVEVSGDRDVDLEVRVDGRSVCSQRSSASTERCEVDGVRVGAALEFEVKGAPEARLVVRTEGRPWVTGSSLFSGRARPEAQVGRDSAEARRIGALSDGRQAVRGLEALLAACAPGARAVVESELSRARAALHAQEARVVLASSDPDRGRSFLREFKGAEQWEAVAAHVASLLEADVDEADDVDDYDAYLNLEVPRPLAGRVQAARGRVASRLAAEERQRRAEEAREAARAAARSRAEDAYPYCSSGTSTICCKKPGGAQCVGQLCLLGIRNGTFSDVYSCGVAVASMCNCRVY